MNNLIFFMFMFMFMIMSMLLLLLNNKLYINLALIKINTEISHMSYCSKL